MKQNYPVEFKKKQCVCGRKQDARTQASQRNMEYQKLVPRVQQRMPEKAEAAPGEPNEKVAAEAAEDISERVP